MRSGRVLRGHAEGELRCFTCCTWGTVKETVLTVQSTIAAIAAIAGWPWFVGALWLTSKWQQGGKLTGTWWVCTVLFRCDKRQVLRLRQNNLTQMISGVYYIYISKYYIYIILYIIILCYNYDMMIYIYIYTYYINWYIYIYISYTNTIGLECYFLVFKILFDTIWR